MSRRHGFTLVELLIVIIIIGILAAIAVPRFVNSRRKAFITSMQSDLRSIASSAESHFSEDQTYALYTPWPGSNGAVVTFVGGLDSWEAQATHPSAPGVVCRVGRGPNSTAPSAPTCTE
jgi:prepilin-type N-terminal cleavage/methylation domain-containing protein